MSLPTSTPPRKAGKRGRLPVVPVVGVGELKSYASALAAPPAAVTAPKMADWGMDGNGPDPTCTVPGAPFGDCTICASAHSVAAWNLDVGTKDAVPNANAVATQYLTLTGGQDTGLACTSVLQAWQTSGLFGSNKIAAWAPVDHTNIIDIHQAIANYGACYIGVNLPDSAETQFENNEPWSYVGDQPTGGHAITLVGYDATYVYCVTWGALQAITYPWLSAYLEESYAIVSQEFIEAGKGPTLDLVSLQSDLASLNMAVVPPKPKKRHPRWWAALCDLFSR